MPLGLVITINSIIQFILLFVLFGLRFQRRTGLNVSLIENVVYKKKLLPISKIFLYKGIVGAFLLGFLIIFINIFIFKLLIEGVVNQAIDTIWWEDMLAIIYGGLTEELMLRLFGMTFIVWLIAKITKKRAQ